MYFTSVSNFGLQNKQNKSTHVRFTNLTIVFEYSNETKKLWDFKFAANIQKCLKI